MNLILTSVHKGFRLQKKLTELPKDITAGLLQLRRQVLETSLDLRCSEESNVVKLNNEAVVSNVAVVPMELLFSIPAVVGCVGSRVINGVFAGLVDFEVTHVVVVLVELLAHFIGLSSTE